MNRAFKTIGVLIVAALLLIAAPEPAAASDIHGHLFFASKMLDGPTKTYLTDDPQTVRMYLLGAVASDSFWLAHLATTPEVRTLLQKEYKVKLPGELDILREPLEDVHLSRPKNVALSLLAAAQTPEESAYVLGWITHFIVDAHIHDLINHRGGYFGGGFDPNNSKIKEHLRLEAVETRHVLTRYSKEMLLLRFNEHDIQSPDDFIVRAFAAAYPEKAAYRPPQAAAFVSIENKSGALMLDSSRWYYFQATHSSQEVTRIKKLIKRFRTNQGRMLELLATLPGEKTYMTTDGAFIQEWENAKDATLASAREIMPLCVLYLWEHQRRVAVGHADELSDQTLARIGEKLKEIAPNDDLIKPRDF